MKIESYSHSEPIEGLCKQHAIWIYEGCVTAPLIYLQRPKWIKDDSVWEQIIQSVFLSLPIDFEVK